MASGAEPEPVRPAIAPAGIADDIDLAKLSARQLDGFACVRCGGESGPMVALYGVIVGVQLFAHAGACPER
jgi:hypothetical protein